MSTDPKRVKEIFLEAAELPDEAARAAFLDRACGEDADLRARVEALLRSHDPAGSFLGTPAAAAADPGLAATLAYSASTGQHHAATLPGDEAHRGDGDEPLTFLAPSTRPDSLGRIGHYEVLQVLGRGGFGIVFRAFDDVLHRVVAVKVLAPQLAATSPARKRFLREARSSAQVRHENVVRVYEVSEQPLPYLAMEFIPGETLQQRLDRVGPVEPAEVVRVGRQIAEGLAAAHAQGLIHRDIKPGNILLEGGAGRVRITDFGLARAADDASISQSGIIAGTPMYMAPEQAKGETLDQRADLFSLGSVLYQMAAGRPPFRANNVVAVLKRVAEDTPRDIREIIPETPQWLCDIIASLHAKDPAGRFQTAREVADLLADCEAQLKASSKLEDFSRIPGRKSASSGKRKRVAAAAALLLPVIALGVTESTGVTKLFRGSTTTDRIRDGGDPRGRPDGGRPNDAPPERVALEFDGVNDYVATPLLYDGSTPLTVEATVRITEWPVHKKHSHSEIVGCTQLAGFGLGTSKEGFYFSAFIGTNYVTAYTPGDDRYLNRPIKLAGIIEGQNLRLFVDGKQIARNAFEDQFKPSPEEISLGTSPGSGMPNDGNGYDWAGTMYGVRISNTARYTGDYDASAPLTADRNTMALYRFDEGSGDVLHDTSGNGRHGKIVGARWVNAGVPRIGPSPDAKTPPAVAPFTDADVQRIAALPAAEQVEEVRMELVRRNPGFDGTVEHKIEGGVVTELRINTDKVSDIAPIRVFNALQVLDCSGTPTPDWRRNGQLADLTPLKGMNLTGLTHLNLGWTKVDDASMVYFKDCKALMSLILTGTQVTDTELAHFKDCKDLTELGLDGTQVSDAGLAHFKGCKKLTLLHIENTRVTDLSLLRGMPLKELSCDFQPERDAEILRSIQTLEKINDKPAAEFWKDVEKK
ncbi:protein kinase domain-containing protein [Tautonia plasticadhaerens]|uniref:non-specific serine/threonine protein kinase n=1 Tax=Tautonia plasticadhaerens TaxID=2527974 RepID=A0A518H303_9BACT|nr:protein kinase [Tautonia plasticadhaerens]QDV35218.1 Serine/threonine-protein kinase PrkC [Tautonia plasticadhaerens]